MNVAVLFRTYASMVLLFFVVSVSNNYAFNYKISVPLHIIFRSVSEPQPEKKLVREMMTHVQVSGTKFLVRVSRTRNLDRLSGALVSI